MSTGAAVGRGRVAPGLRGVLFDLDGTLLDHRGAADLAIAEWASAIPGARKVTDPARRWLQLESEYFRLYEEGECTIWEQRRMRIRAFCPALADLDDARADALFDEYAALYRTHWRAFPGAVDLVTEALRAGCAVGVLTNGDEPLQRAKLDSIGLTRPEVRLLATSTLGVAKPAARAFELACEVLGTPISATVMIGDSYDTDIRGARAAGLHAIHVTPARDPDEDDGTGSLLRLATALFGEE